MHENERHAILAGVEWLVVEAEHKGTAEAPWPPHLNTPRTGGDGGGGGNAAVVEYRRG